MTYTKRNDITAAPGWAVVELDDGTLARVRCDKSTVEGGVSYHAQAEAIDADGQSLRDPAGKPIATGFKHMANVQQIERDGDSAITLAVLLLVLGEPTTLIPWPESTRNGTSTNLRARIAAVAVSGPADAGAVL